MILTSFSAEIRKKLPILSWSLTYDLNKAISDLIAGITVGLTLIPQSIAYASLAELEPQYGLYSSLCGGIIYALFGTIPELNIGPTAIISLLTFSCTQNLSYNRVYGVVLLCFLSGVAELVCGALKLGFLLDFVSLPVVSAFTTAGAITVGSSQLKNLLGLKFSGSSVINVWKNVFTHITDTQLGDATLGFCCILILLFLRKLKDYGTPPVSEKSCNIFKTTLWFFSVGRNAFIVVFCAVLAYIFLQNNENPFALTSQVPSGFPPIGPPPFSLTQNDSITLNFLDLVKELGSGVFMVPFVSILGNVAIAKAFAHGKVVDASQEMIALGICNLIGSFVSSYPVNASFSRSAVGNASGVKTPLAGLYTGIMVILAFHFLTPYFSYIPKATLSAVIICAIIFMIEVSIIKYLWDINRYELIPFTITLISALLFGIEMGIMTGICVDITKLLHVSARPEILSEQMKTVKGTPYLKITPTSSILFSSAEFFRDQVLKSAIKANIQTITIDFNRISTMDFTSTKCLESLLNDLQKRKLFTLLFHVNERIQELLKKTSFIETSQVKLIKSEEELDSCVDAVDSDLVHITAL